MFEADTYMLDTLCREYRTFKKWQKPGMLRYYVSNWERDPQCADMTCGLTVDVYYDNHGVLRIKGCDEPYIRDKIEQIEIEAYRKALNGDL